MMTAGAKQEGNRVQWTCGRCRTWQEVELPAEFARCRVCGLEPDLLEYGIGYSIGETPAGCIVGVTLAVATVVLLALVAAGAI